MADYIHVNLLPIEYRVVKRDFTWIIDMRVLSAIAILLAVGAAWLTAGSFFESNLQSKRAILKQVEDEIGRNAYVAQKIHDLETLRDEKTAKNNSLKSISVSKRKWVRILEGINKSLPLNMWIEIITQDEKNENELTLKGRTFIFPEVAEYMLELGKNEFFHSVQLGSIEFQKEGERPSFLFNVKVTLNPNAGLEVLVHEDQKEKAL